MKQGILFLTLLAAVFFAVPATASDIKKETHIYAIKGADTLQLDRYYTANINSGAFEGISESRRPVMIFMFGGGFFSGKRNSPKYIPYFEWLAEKGFNVVSIDYRLGLKPIVDEMTRKLAPGEKRQKTGIFTMVKMLFSSVDIAVEDLYSATNFVISNGNTWGVDTSRVVTCGSSAGAISVLQGEYMRNNNISQGVLPKNFQYAGVITFAGAIVKKNIGGVKWSGNPAPMLMFHGNADSNVPYDKLNILFGGFYGPAYLTKLLDKLDTSYWFYTIDNATHTVATSPMDDNREQIERFLTKMVIAGEPLIINESVATVGEPKKPKKFGVTDFIKANFGSGGDKVTLLSYNVRNCIAIDSASTRDYERIADIIKSSGANVAALQELDSVTTRTPLYVLDVLADSSNMISTYAPAIDYAGGKYGIGILSKEKPLATKRVPLPGREESRALLITEYNNYIFCSTHFSLTEEKQLLSVDIIKREINLFRAQNSLRKKKPVFIAGDFNATPGSKTIDAMLKIATPVSNIRLKSFPADAPSETLDYIFVMGRKMPKCLEVMVSERLVTPQTSIASDHLPILVRVEISK